MRRPRAWLRHLALFPDAQMRQIKLYAQDEPTYILLGRWAHLYNHCHNDWFVVTEVHPYDVSDGPLWINRANTRLHRRTIRQWLRITGWRGLLEIIEDLCGVRLCRICGWLRWTRIPWILRWEKIDEIQAPEFGTRYERPQIKEGG